MCKYCKEQKRVEEFKKELLKHFILKKELNKKQIVRKYLVWRQKVLNQSNEVPTAYKQRTK